MELIWWAFPAIAGVVGLMLVFAGAGKLFRLKPFSGLTRLVFGTGFVGMAGVIALTGLNLQTYKRLTFERPVATITFTENVAEDGFTAQLLYPGGEEDVFELRGDEWELNARVVKFKAFSNILGFDSVYKLDRLYGRYEDVGRAGETNGVRLSTDPGLDVFSLAKQQGGAFGVQDASYGSAVYNPMDAGLSYDFFMTQAALIARPANDLTRTRLGTFADEGNAVSAPSEGPTDNTQETP